MSKYGPNRTPPTNPSKKSKFGAIREPAKSTPGRTGIHSQPKDSFAYVPNKQRRYKSGEDKPSGPGGSD